MRRTGGAGELWPRRARAGAWCGIGRTSFAIRFQVFIQRPANVICSREPGGFLQLGELCVVVAGYANHGVTLGFGLFSVFACGHGGGFVTSQTRVNKFYFEKYQRGYSGVISSCVRS